jgi:multiple sugar transport system ATP-binding protein
MEDAGLEEATAMAEAEGSNVVEVEAQVIESMGSEKYVYFEPPREQTVHLESVAEMTGDTGGSEKDIGGGSAEDPGGNLMVARVSAESTAREGQKMRLMIDSTKIHLFDLETEKAIF